MYYQKTSLLVKIIPFFLFILFIFDCSIVNSETTSLPTYDVVTFSDVQTIDRIYPSMQGPMDYMDVDFQIGDQPEILWMISSENEIINAKTKLPESQEYLCHSHLKFDYKTFNKKKRNSLLGGKTHQERIIFTHFQGQPSITFPKNFGIPIISNERFIYNAMVINNNELDEIKDIQTKATFKVVRGKDANEKFKPLFRTHRNVLVPVKFSEIDYLKGKGSHKGSPKGSHKGSDSGDISQGPKKERTRMNGHWLVPPGRHSYRQVIKPKHKIFPFDTTVHYITAHAHAYAESVIFRDLTDDKVLYISKATNYDDRIGIAHLTHYSSERGFPVYANHKYEIEAIYNNTTDHNIDGMNIMFFYLHDKNFKIR